MTPSPVIGRAYTTSPTQRLVHSNLVHTLLYHPAYDAGAILRECLRWNDQHAQPLAHLIRPHTHNTQEERRLRVGYVSSDFREHVDSFFTVPLFSNHDHRQFRDLFSTAASLIQTNSPNASTTTPTAGAAPSGSAIRKWPNSFMPIRLISWSI